MQYFQKKKASFSKGVKWLLPPWVTHWGPPNPKPVFLGTEPRWSPRSLVVQKAEVPCGCRRGDGGFCVTGCWAAMDALNKCTAESASFLCHKSTHLVAFLGKMPLLPKVTLKQKFWTCHKPVLSNFMQLLVLQGCNQCVSLPWGMCSYYIDRFAAGH